VLELTIVSVAASVTTVQQPVVGEVKVSSPKT